MTPKDVRNYRFLDQIIRIAEKKLDDLSVAPTLSDKVFGSNPEYPYEERSFNVTGIDERQTLDHIAKQMAAEQEYHRLIRLKISIDTAAREIEDPADKLMFELTMKGMSQTQVAKKMGIDQTTVSKRLLKICKEYT